MTERLDLEKCSKNLYPKMEQPEWAREVRSTSFFFRVDSGGTMGSSPMSGGFLKATGFSPMEGLTDGDGVLERLGGFCSSCFSELFKKEVADSFLSLSSLPSCSSGDSGKCWREDWQVV
ncbi:hypothetical protein CEXT_289061 [Caerostris extrusa]|uniref:Uncharacterized protein n=1 Tax=Caerostris extrusa TaxID=172846 RepID=A0AAV4UJD6_CAEEX|nr:hypothetical protein CEXT_289061 [Caerostris extrusa]